MCNLHIRITIKSSRGHVQPQSTPDLYAVYKVFLFVCLFVCSSLGGHVLQIPRVQIEDAGKYTCQAVNEAGEDKMHYDLEVLGKEVNPTDRSLWHSNI